MDKNLLILFIVLNVVNVIIQTIKSLVTIKAGKWVASIVNAITYGFYTIVVVYMVCDLPLMVKVFIVGLCNLVGVFVVKWGEEIARKDKLWKVEATVSKSETYQKMIYNLRKAEIPCNYIDIGNYVIVNCYCATQAESAKVKEILDFFHAKYFVSESKTLY